MVKLIAWLFCAVSSYSRHRVLEAILSNYTPPAHWDDENTTRSAKFGSYRISCKGIGVAN